MKFPASIYRKWLKNKIIFKKLGYHFLDFFYWEERLGIWLSKSWTEQLGLNKLVVSPYNSRMFLDSLLSVERKYRGEHFNHLQNQIIAVLCNDNKKVVNLSINPIFRKKICIILYKLNLYAYFRYIGLKIRFF